METYTVQFETYEFEIKAETDYEYRDDSDRSYYGHGGSHSFEADIRIKREDVVAAMQATIYDGCDEAFDGETYTFADGTTCTVDQLLSHAESEIEDQIHDEVLSRGW